MAATENNINTNNMSEPYFEGVEKLLEVWFTNGDSSRQGDLRKIPRLVHTRYLSTFCID